MLEASICGLAVPPSIASGKITDRSDGMDMSPTSQTELVQEASVLPGAVIVARIRRLLVTAVIAAFGYGALMTASKGYCPGGVTADGEFIDAAGSLVDMAPTCINLTLKPNGLIYLVLAAIVLYALTVVLRRASDVPSAVRYLDRAAAATAILIVASIIIAQVWFALIPISDWNGSGTFFYPFPFGSVELVTSPMTTS